MTPGGDPVSQPPPTAGEMADLGLAARLLLAADGGDHDQVTRLIGGDPLAAVDALLLLAGGLAGELYGERARDVLAGAATAAELDAIGRQVTG